MYYFSIARYKASRAERKSSVRRTAQFPVHNCFPDFRPTWIGQPYWFLSASMSYLQSPFPCPQKLPPAICPFADGHDYSPSALDSCARSKSRTSRHPACPRGYKRFPPRFCRERSHPYIFSIQNYFTGASVNKPATDPNLSLSVSGNHRYRKISPACIEKDTFLTLIARPDFLLSVCQP